ncbi:MAG: NUDIX hydrolase [Actinobacteria bacterium]|nr:NUDIX hydrolase [Actinomycetota bacterium]
MKWTVYGTRRIYHNAWVSLDLVDVELPDGQRFEHHVVRLDPVAAAVIVDDQERGLLLWRHRFIVDTWGYELPTGIVEAGETPAETALREAVEETGWRPRNLTPLVSYYPCAGIASAHHLTTLWATPARTIPARGSPLLTTTSSSPAGPWPRTILTAVSRSPALPTVSTDDADPDLVWLSQRVQPLASALNERSEPASAGVATSNYVAAVQMNERNELTRP